MNLNRLLAIASMTAIAAASTAGASIFTVTVNLNGLSEVPPNASPGIGVADVTVDTDSGLVQIEGQYSGMLAPVIAAHLHGLAGPNQNAPVLFGLNTTGGTNGTFTGQGILSAANLQGLLNDLTYINVHTDVFPGGEIRGQVIVPAPAVLIALGAVPIVARRRRT